MMTRLAGALARLTWITSGYGWLAMVVPIVVAAPGYFDGDLSFGTPDGGRRFQSGAVLLRWFVDNLPQIADWRATLLRVVAFSGCPRDGRHDRRGHGSHRGRRLAVRQARARRFRARALPGMRDAGPEPRRDQPGERIQIPATLPPERARCSERSRAWAWGGGTLRLPPRETMTFMPQRPYLCLGTLRDAVSYPQSPALRRDCRGRRAGAGGPRPPCASLDRTDRWDRQLPLEEQQRLAVARLAARAALGRPRRRDQRARPSPSPRARALRSRTGR